MQIQNNKWIIHCNSLCLNHPKYLITDSIKLFYDDLAILVIVSSVVVKTLHFPCFVKNPIVSFFKNLFVFFIIVLKFYAVKFWNDEDLKKTLQ